MFLALTLCLKFCSVSALSSKRVLPLNLMQMSLKYIKSPEDLVFVQQMDVKILIDLEKFVVCLLRLERKINLLAGTMLTDNSVLSLQLSFYFCFVTHLMYFNLVYFYFFVPFFLVKQLQLDLFVHHMLKWSHLMEIDFLLHIIVFMYCIHFYVNCSKMWEIKNLKIQWNAKIKQGKGNYSPNCRLQFPFGSIQLAVMWRSVKNEFFFFPPWILIGGDLLWCLILTSLQRTHSWFSVRPKLLIIDQQPDSCRQTFFRCFGAFYIFLCLSVVLDQLLSHEVMLWSNGLDFRNYENIF